MDLIHLNLILLSLILFENISAQTEEVLNMAIEKDNKFPPDVFDNIGSVNEINVTDRADNEVANLVPTFKIDNRTTLIKDILANRTSISCPDECACFSNRESDFIVDCSNSNLSVIPKVVDNKCTKLNLNNNNIQMLPESLDLPKLKVLNISKNSIKELNFKFMKKLPSITILDISNNKLQKIDNHNISTMLEELDMGGHQNVVQGLSAKIFENFPVLRKLTLPITTMNLVEELCELPYGSIETICNISCNIQLFKCHDIIKNNEDELFDATLPGMIAFTSAVGKIGAIKEILKNNKTNISKNTMIENTTQNVKTKIPLSPDVFTIANVSRIVTKMETTNNNGEASGASSSKKDNTTLNVKSGKVDKKIILAVAIGMIIVITVVSLNRNWTSIKRKFSQSPKRTERATEEANGVLPEETPLNRKSHV